MTEETKAAIQTVSDLWDSGKLAVAHVADMREVNRAMILLREGLREENHCLHIHNLKCWIDRNGQDQQFKSCGELDWQEQKQRISDLSHEVQRQYAMLKSAGEERIILERRISELGKDLKLMGI